MAGVLMVRDVMTKAVKTVRVDDSVMEAVQKMNKFRISSVVVTEGKRPVGILTERDILERIVEHCIDPRVIKVRESMSSPIVTIRPHMSIEEAAGLMAQKKIKKLPVIADDKLVGIVTSMDIMRAAPKLVNLLEDLLRIGK